jgi:tripartite-type tricarboxylate transporter receptor subunit TctC
MTQTFSLSPIAGGIVAALSLLVAGTAAAQTAPAYPSGPVEIILPYSAGGGVDAMARAFAREAARDGAHQWVVNNREGAGGVVGFTALSRAKPDGSTIMFSPASPLTNSPFVNSKLPFKASDIEPVCQVFENVFAIAVRESSPIQNMTELLARAQANPGAVSYGHAGPASVPHLSMAAIERATKVKFNAIAYRGDGAMLTDVMGGTLDFSTGAISSIVGKNLRVLAVLSDKRQPALPNVPSIAELGYPVISPGLNGLYVPAGTPKAVVSQLEGICRKVTASPAYIEAAKGLQQVPKFLTAAQYKARIASTYKTHAELVPDLNLEKN